MLNFFCWYGWIWLIVFILYALNLTEFSIPLDLRLVVFLAVTIIISILFGYIYRKELVFKYSKSQKIVIRKTTMILILIGVVIDFIYAKEVPFISLAITGSSHYKDFKGIPTFHVFLICYSTYFAIKCFYAALIDKRNRKRYLFYFVIVQGIYLLNFLRSQILFNFFSGGVIFVAYLKSKGRIKFKYYLYVMMTALFTLYAFGGLGNLRHGYSWNDCSYIDRLGLYIRWPSFIPEQFKWAYSYITTPLANLNYHIINAKPKYDLFSLFLNLLPDAIAKRIYPPGIKSDALLIRMYFNVSTGYQPAYSAFGFFGMIIYFISIYFISFFGLFLAKKKRNSNNGDIFYAIMCVVIAYLFFANTLCFAGTSIVLWISLFSMLLFIFTLRKRKIMHQTAKSKFKMNCLKSLLQILSM